MANAHDDRPRDAHKRGVLLGVNALGIASAAAFAATGVARPNYAQPAASVSSLTRFWSAASAVRTWSFAAPLLIGLVRGRRPAPELLTVAGLVQLGDCALGVWQRNPRMAVFPAAMGLVHLTSARRERELPQKRDPSSSEAFTTISGSGL